MPMYNPTPDLGDLGGQAEDLWHRGTSFAGGLWDSAQSAAAPIIHGAENIWGGGIPTISGSDNPWVD